MLFGLMWGVFLGLVILGLAIYATLQHGTDSNGRYL